ncbi:hypothetical protein [Streptomyces sp. enrichment culture]|uniref:hypothetical protein n=1 Tax=Streptomyces sp. enrichment culture TaxID=1795815 RepID=UPI003F5611B2
MSRGHRVRSLALTVPLAVLTLVLLAKTMGYPAFGMSVVLVMALLFLAHAIRDQFREEPPERPAPLGPRDRAFLALVCIVTALAVVLPLDRPWNAPWWPGRHESLSLPGPCEAGVTAAATLVPAGAVTAEEDDDGPYGPTAQCAWRDPEGPQLRLEYQLVDWEGSFGGTATDTAREVFADGLTIGTRSPLPGIGDEAWRVESSALHTVRARKANVIVEATLIRAHDDPPGRAAMETLLRTAVARIRTG